MMELGLLGILLLVLVGPRDLRDAADGSAFFPEIERHAARASQIGVLGAFADFNQVDGNAPLLHVKTAHGDGQGEAAWTGAAGIDI